MKTAKTQNGTTVTFFSTADASGTIESTTHKVEIRVVPDSHSDNGETYHLHVGDSEQPVECGSWEWVLDYACVMIDDGMIEPRDQAT